MSQRIIALSHIAKTAGTSINYIFRRYYGASLMACRYRKGAEQQSYSRENLVNDLKYFGNCLCISGHCLRPWVDYGDFEDNLQRIIFVREPEKRFLSLYIHEQTGKDARYHMDLIDWARKYNRRNGMVQYIAGEQSVQKAIDILEAKKIHVGVQSQYDESLRQIKKVMRLDGFDLSNQKKKMEVRDSSLKSAIYDNYSHYADCIKSNNELDEQLYEYVLSNIWPKQVRQDEGLVDVKNDEENIDRYWQFVIKDRFVYRPYCSLNDIYSQLFR